MRVAFFLHEFPKISETFILNQITGLIDRGCTVDIYAQKADDAPLHADVKRYNLLANTIYYRTDHRMLPRNFLIRLLKALTIFARYLFKNPRPLLKSLNPTQFGKQAYSLWMFYHTAMFLDYGIDHYDAVHCHFGPRGKTGAMLKATGAITGKLLTTFYGYDVTRYVQIKGPQVYESLFTQADHILVLSQVMQKQLVQLGCPPEKVIIHHLGVDPDEFKFSPRQAKGDAVVNILTTARLVEKKGVEYGIRAIAKVLTTYPHLLYQIAGDGPLRPQLEELIAELGVQDQVQLLGWQQKSAMLKLLANTDIMLMPCVVAKDGDEEGTPTALVEASAHGIPIVSTWHSGIPEVVLDNQSGLLVQERDVDALADKLRYLLTHQDCWAEMGGQGRQHILAHFDVNKLNDQLMELYRQPIRY